MTRRVNFRTVLHRFFENPTDSEILQEINREIDQAPYVKQKLHEYFCFASIWTYCVKKYSGKDNTRLFQKVDQIVDALNEIKALPVMKQHNLMDALQFESTEEELSFTINKQALEQMAGVIKAQVAGQADSAAGIDTKTWLYERNFFYKKNTQFSLVPYKRSVNEVYYIANRFKESITFSEIVDLLMPSEDIHEKLKVIYDLIPDFAYSDRSVHRGNALHCAIANEDDYLFDALLDFFKGLEDLAALAKLLIYKDAHGNTPLNLAINLSREDVAIKLLEALEYILTRNSDLGDEIKDKMLNDRNAKDCAPIHGVALLRMANVYKKLIRMGVDMDATLSRESLISMIINPRQLKKIKNGFNQMLHSDQLFQALSADDLKQHLADLKINVNRCATYHFNTIRMGVRCAGDWVELPAIIPADSFKQTILSKPKNACLVEAFHTESFGTGFTANKLGLSFLTGTEIGLNHLCNQLNSVLITMGYPGDLRTYIDFLDLSRPTILEVWKARLPEMQRVKSEVVAGKLSSVTMFAASAAKVEKQHASKYTEAQIKEAVTVINVKLGQAFNHKNNPQWIYDNEDSLLLKDKQFDDKNKSWFESRATKHNFQISFLTVKSGGVNKYKLKVNIESLLGNQSVARLAPKAGA